MVLGGAQDLREERDGARSTTLDTVDIEDAFATTYKPRVPWTSSPRHRKHLHHRGDADRRSTPLGHFGS
jgi:hypothetical protein